MADLEEKIEALIAAVEKNTTAMDDAAKDAATAKTTSAEERAEREKKRKDDKDEAQKAKQRARDRQKINDALKKSFKALTSVVSKLSSFAIRPLISATKEGFNQFQQFEKVGAQFNKSLDGNLDAYKGLADNLGAGGGFVTNLEAFGAQLRVQNMGMSINTKGLQSLYKVTQKSGEDFFALAGGLKEVTAGFSSNDLSMNKLVTHQEKLVTALGLTRQQIVEAMSALSEETKDMAAALKIGGMQETLAEMKGLLKGTPALFNTMAKNFQAMLGPGGLQKSVMQGVAASRQAMLSGGVDLESLMEQVFQAAERAQGLAPKGAGMVAPEIMDALAKSGVIDPSNIRIVTEIQKQAADLLGEATVKQMGARELVVAWREAVKERAEQEVGFTRSLELLKKTVLMPFINFGADIAAKFKKFLENNADRVKEFGEKVVNFGKVLLGGLFKFVDFFADKVMPHMRLIVSLLVAAAAAKAGSGVGSAIGAAIGMIGGPLGMIAGAKIGGALGGLAAGATAGIATHQGLGDDPEKGYFTEFFTDMANSLTETADNTGKLTKNSDEEIDQMKKDRQRGNLKDLIDNIDGFARFQIRQTTLIEAGLKEINTQLGDVAYNTDATAMWGKQTAEKKGGATSPSWIPGITQTVPGR